MKNIKLSDMRHFIVNHTEPNSTVADWKEAIKTSFGITYYNDMMMEILQQYATFYWVYELQEQYMYGSSRLGSVQRHLPLVQQVLNSDSLIYYSYTNDSIRYMERGQKRFELSNHLGNVLAVVSDRKLVHCSGEELMWFEAHCLCRRGGMVSVTDYYPFGMEIKERTYSVSSYRYGFNGMERDDELKGSGNSYDFGARIYDSRLGRWWSLDPLMKKYPSLSDYSFVANNPIIFIDPDGRIIDLSNLTPEQKADYKAVLDKLSKSELHSYVLNALESSSEIYTIIIDNEMRKGGSFNPKTGEIKMNLTAMNLLPEIASEEMFHAFQKDRLGEHYSEVSRQNLEAEGDLYVMFVQTELYGELGIRFDFQHLDYDLAAELGVNDRTTSSEDMNTEDYQSLYGQLVQKRYEKYKDDPKAPSSYKEEPSEHPPSSLIKVMKEKEANEQNLEGPRLENGDYYGS